MVLAPKPDFKAIEQKWQKYWLDNKIYKFDTKSKKKVFSIDTPPPYISGNLHMGHGVSYTGFEFIARYKKMTGFNVFFPIGFDDNGHPTERYVEKKHNIRSTDIPRQKFIELCRKETELLEKTAKESFVRLGHSYDWDLFYSTISDKAIKISQQSFLDLYKRKLVYRAEEPGLWCVECQTALSQADVEDEERETVLNFIDFKLEDGGAIQIATTRPELLPACVGIFVHPEDARYKKFVGKNAVVPLFHHVVPIIADKKVDPNFGTGAVMICTFGDKTDVEWWRAHGLALRVVLGKDGRLNSEAHEFAGQKIKEARESIIAKLKETEHLIKQSPLKQNVGVCWRCHKPVELIITKQWAIKAVAAKKQILEAGRKVNWVPEYLFKRFEDWVKNLNTDWVISRQRHYGVPIPVWYCRACGSELVAHKEELPIDPNTKLPAKSKCLCGSSEWQADRDVFDTWMTSSLTPQINCGFSKDSIPFDLRPQGYEIIRTWAFYTILKSLYHFKKIPWKNAMINGMVLDPKGKAMHKSTGNVIDPMEQVGKYGADAFRYFASTVNIGEDAPFQEKEIVRGQKLLIKLWNVAKFFEPWKESCKEPGSKNIIDAWILSRLSQVISEYHKGFENYDAVTARRVLENFFWHEYCDFYLEIVKHRLYSNDQKQINEAAWALYQSFWAILRLFAPFLPHITEEIYQEIFEPYVDDISIHVTKMPESDIWKSWKFQKSDLQFGDLAVEAIAEIRKWKADNKLSIGAEVEKLVLQHPKAKDLEKVKTEIAATMRIRNLEITAGELKITQ